MESPNFASLHGRWTINMSIERVEKVKRTLLTRDPKQSGGGKQLIVLTTLLNENGCDCELLETKLKGLTSESDREHMIGTS